MILGLEELKKLVEEQNLVEKLCERERNNPEGAGFDLRMGEVHALEGEGYLGVEERKTPESKLLAQYKGDEPEELFTFEPGRYHLIKTIEKINLPLELSAAIFSRGTLFRSGLGLFNGIVHGGYQGELTFGICNFGLQPVKIALGARVAHIVFHQVAGQANHYRGQWQGGRVSTKKKEKQV